MLSVELELILHTTLNYLTSFILKFDTLKCIITDPDEFIIE